MLTGTFEPCGAILLRIPPEHPQYEAVAAEVARGKKEAAKSIALSGADEGGRWITIGGKAGEDGKKHGGSPVYIDSNGKITKGHSSLVDKPINALKKTTHSVHAAETSGVNPEHSHQLGGEILAHDHAFKMEEPQRGEPLTEEEAHHEAIAHLQPQSHENLESPKEASLSDRAKAFYEGIPEYKDIDAFMEELHGVSKDEANAALQAMGFSKQPSKSAAIAKVETLLKNRRENKDKTKTPAESTPEQRAAADEAGKRAEGTGEPPPPREPATPHPEAATISISGSGKGETPVATHIAKLKELYDDFQNQDYAALDQELSAIGSDLTTEGARQLAKGFGMAGRFKNRQALMEAIRDRIASRREMYMRTHFHNKPEEHPVGQGTPLESIHEKRVKHFRSALSQADPEHEAAIDAARLVVRDYLDRHEG